VRQLERSERIGAAASSISAASTLAPSRGYAGALVLIALLVPLHSLWAVQVLLIPLLLVVPGAILLQALRVPGAAVSSFPVYVPCASLIVLLGSGLAVDLIGPLLGVAAPLRTGPLLVGFELVCLALLAVAYDRTSGCGDTVAQAFATGPACVAAHPPARRGGRRSSAQ
jgi:uncharacterized membrane protein